jgi:hypothetical protein
MAGPQPHMKFFQGGRFAHHCAPNSAKNDARPVCKSLALAIPAGFAPSRRGLPATYEQAKFMGITAVHLYSSPTMRKNAISTDRKLRNEKQ